MLATTLDIRQILAPLGEAVRPAIAFDAMGVIIFDTSSEQWAFFGTAGEAPASGIERIPAREFSYGPALMAGRTVLFDEASREVNPDFPGDRILLTAGLESCLWVPMHFGDEVGGTLFFGKHEPRSYDSVDVEVGVELHKGWQLPPTLSEVAAHHHGPVAQTELASLVHLVRMVSARDLLRRAPGANPRGVVEVVESARALGVAPLAGDQRAQQLEAAVIGGERPCLLEACARVFQTTFLQRHQAQVGPAGRLLRGQLGDSTERRFRHTTLTHLHGGGARIERGDRLRVGRVGLARALVVASRQGQAEKRQRGPARLRQREFTHGVDVALC